MKQLYLFISLFILVNMAFPSTYLVTTVNDQEQSTITQGDVLTWEYDVSVIGGSALFSIYLDLDQDGELSDNDILVVEFEQTDGVADEDGPPPDQSGEDGIITTTLGHFGFAPAHYILRVIDLNDDSQIMTPLVIEPLRDVKIWASGTLTKEDKTAPDTSLANIMIFSEPDNMNMGFWSGLTDSQGNYTINYPDSAASTVWKISIEFENMIQGYVTDDGYSDVQLSLGENSPFDFYLELPNTFVYGKVYDEQDNLIPVHDYLNLVNLNSHQESDAEIIDGSYRIPALFDGSDTTDVPFQLDIWGAGLVPDYMAPNTWDDPSYRFNLSVGDSLEKNIYVYSTDTVIYAEVREEGQTPAQNYTLHAYHETFGNTWNNTNASGFAVLSVRNASEYSVWLDTEEDGQSTLPPGYIVKDGPERTASPGDTVRFNVIPAMSHLTGRLFIPQAVDSLFDPDEADMWLMDSLWNHIGNFSVDPDLYSFDIPTGNGKYYVQFHYSYDDFLSFPAARYVEVENDTIDSLRFDLSYTNAVITVRIINGPTDFPQNYSWMSITSRGNYPDVYQSNSPVYNDSTYRYKVCPAEWVLSPPYFGEDYKPLSKDTVISVHPDSSQYYVEFVYQKPTAIITENKIPSAFYVNQNYPNPFNPSTTIPIGLPAKMHVSLDVFNLAGQRVAQVLDKELPAGKHNIVFDGSNLASGIYFYRVVTPKNVITKKFILIK